MLSRRRVLVAVVVLLLILGGVAFRYLRLGELLHLGAGYSAQVVCGCIFISKRTMESCKGDLDPLAQKLVRITQGDDAISARALFGTATARYDSTYGCAITD